MKGRKLEKKLRLKKFTVANMPRHDMSRVYGGDGDSPMCTDGCVGEFSLPIPECKLMTDIISTTFYC